jgi:uncharacterized membrane protein YjjP (DUF1212 family)
MQVWRSLELGNTSVKEATLELEQMMAEKPIYKTWQRIAVAAMMSGIICPMAFSGGFADAMLAVVFAGTLTWLKLTVAARNPRFGDVFECVLPSCYHYTRTDAASQNHSSHCRFIRSQGAIAYRSHL